MRILVTLALFAAALTSCTSTTEPECTSSVDCPTGQRCVDGTCQSGSDSGPFDTGVVDTGSPVDSGDTGAVDSSADTGVTDTSVADTGATDTMVADTGVVDTGTPECSLGMYQACPMGAQYCLTSEMWSACRTSDATCTGAGGTYRGCRGNGCAVCISLLVGYDCYFENHPSCAPNRDCGGSYFTCSPGCPAPTPADRCP